MRRFTLLGGVFWLLMGPLSAQVLPEGWHGRLPLETTPGPWVLELRPTQGEIPLVTVETPVAGGGWRWLADNRSPVGIPQERLEFVAEREVRLVVAKALPAALTWSLRSVEFSGLSGALRKTLSQALGQVTPLKLRASARPGTAVSASIPAVDRQGNLWSALVTDNIVRLWSLEKNQGLGNALDLGGEPLGQVALTFDRGDKPVIVLAGSTVRVFSWTGKAWAREGLPAGSGGPPFSWTPELRLRGWSGTGDRRVLVETPWLSPGFGRAEPSVWVGTPDWSTVLGTLPAAHLSALATYPGTWSRGVRTGSLNGELAVWDPEHDSPLSFWNATNGWRSVEVPEGLAASALSNGGGLLQVWDARGTGRLWQFDGQDWRIPLPLETDPAGESSSWEGHFLPPHPMARTGLLVLTRVGKEARIDVWELP